MYNHLLYFAYWAINSLIFYIVATATPDSAIKLGSWRFSTLEASIYAGFCMTFIIWVWWDFAMARKFNLKKRAVALGFFFFVNCFSLWVLSRFSYFTGFSVTNYSWILLIGLVATIFQRITRRAVVGKSFS